MLNTKRETPELSSNAQENYSDLFRLHMPMIETIATTAPTTDTLPVGYFQRYYDGTNYRLYHNQDGTMIYFTGTAA